MAGVLMFDSDLERISVILRDPDGDDLDLIWTPPPLAVSNETTSRFDDVYSTRIDIEYTDDIEGAEFVLTVIDSEEAFDLTWLVGGP